MSPSAYLVWAALSSRRTPAGYARYTIADIATAIGRSRRSVQYGLQELREAGMIGFAEQVAPGVYQRPIYYPVNSLVGDAAA